MFSHVSTPAVAGGKPRYYFSGIGGVSMSALAEHLYLFGERVEGSDRTESEITRALVKKGIKVTIGQKKENLACFGAGDVFVYTSAVRPGNPEYAEAKKRRMRFLRRSELLGEILSRYPVSVAVCGTHGKTTTTAMLSEILLAAGGVTAFVGGETRAFGAYCNRSENFAVAEACEYEKNFLDLAPQISVVTNVDRDHVDTYTGIEDELSAFSAFIRGTISYVNADDAAASRLRATHTYGEKNGVKKEYAFCKIKPVRGGTRFTVYKSGKRYGRLFIPLYGKHNVYNAVAALAAADGLSVRKKTVIRALKAYSGVRRRGENIGARGKTSFFSDYAHHPREIKAALAGLAPRLSKETLVIFQSHTYSRTKALFSDFVSALSLPYRVALFPTYAAREAYDEAGSGKRLFAALKEKGVAARYFEDPKALFTYALTFDSVVILGAGDLPETLKSYLISPA